MKRLVKRGLQHFAARFGPHVRAQSAPQLLVLMYHRILPVDDPRARIEEPGMLVSPETFRRHLKLINESFEIVSLTEWLERKNAGLTLPDRACAITFDDGWADNHEFAWPILREQSIPATIFLVSEMIGSDRMFWPERLARTLDAIADNPETDWSHPQLQWLKSTFARYPYDGTQPTQDQISELVDAIKKYPDDEIHARMDTLENTLRLEIHSGAPSLLDWNQVTEMVASGLIEVGSHTCNHIRLDTGTSHTRMEKEIIASKTIIEEHTQKQVNTFCFPNGDVCTEALILVRQNYLGAVTTSSGWNSNASDNYLLRRIGVHEDISADRTSFLARISGWM